MSDDPEFLGLKKLLSDQPEFPSWEQMWHIRTKVGELMLGARPEWRSVYKTVYDELTNSLKVRAEELGKGEEFAEIEKTSQQLDESENIAGQLMDADSGIKVFDILNDPAKQNELAALQRLMESAGRPKNYVDQVRDSAKASYRIAKSGRAGDRLRLRDIFGFAIEWVKYKIK